MTRHTTIIAGRGSRRRSVRVERKRPAWTRDQIRGEGVKAVGDALFRLGGPLTGADVLRILCEPPKGVRSGNRENLPATPEIPSAIKAPDHDPVLQKAGQNMRENMPGALADDVCRRINFARGSFGPALIGGWL